MSLSKPKQTNKRIRSNNYTFQEKNLLLNIVLKFKSIIESKKSDAITWREKELAWIKVTDLFNANSNTGNHRSTTSLKKIYDNVKKKVRKDVADEKSSQLKTGGGPSDIIIKDPNFELAVDLMNSKAVYGLKNDFDKDGLSSDISKHNLSEEHFLEVEAMEQSHEIEESEGAQSEEEIILEIEQDGPCEANWGDFKASYYNTPVSSKLIPQSKKSKNDCFENNEGVIDENITPPNKNIAENITPPNKNIASSTSSKWTSRNRPVISSLAATELSKKYNQLAELKIELAQLQIKLVRYECHSKKERDQVEFELRKKSLELEIKIKDAYLRKLNSTNIPLNFFPSTYLVLYGV